MRQRSTGNPSLVKHGRQVFFWIPAYAGMTAFCGDDALRGGRLPSSSPRRRGSRKSISHHRQGQACPSRDPVTERRTGRLNGETTKNAKGHPLVRAVHGQPATTNVGDYVPFYFCPRSIILYVIYRRNHPQLKYLGGQEEIIHLEADLTSVVQWADENQRRWALTNRGTPTPTTFSP